MKSLFAAIIICLTLASCSESHIVDHPEWGEFFQKNGITDACFILNDHTHERVGIYNRERCQERFSPASTFKIFNSLVALETSVAEDDALVLPWDGIKRRPEVDTAMNMRDAFRLSNVGYYQEIARRIGKQNFQHYLDTVKYGNMEMSDSVTRFWLDNSLKISADEQAGFVKRLYFDELPFLERSQSIVKSMMLREDSADNRLYYKTGTVSTTNDSMLYWVVGYFEHVVPFKEDPQGMNKSGVRNYPYFFAMNFQVAKDDQSQHWQDLRIKILKEILHDFGADRTK
ncbi:MAG: penicillin-binding transpeptidase domain-containing protein [Chitinophagaceae bacterium]